MKPVHPRRPKKFALPFRNPLALKQAPRRVPLAAKTDRKALIPERPPKNLWEKITRRVTRRKFKFTWKKFWISLGVTFGVLVIAVAAVFAYFAPSIPNPKSLTERPIAQSTKIVDRNGTLLYELHGEQNRTVVADDQISPYVKQATVAVEDATFYSNHGFDLKGILRSVLVRLHILHNEMAGGGSTITQQYVKNALLLNADGTADESLSRKAKELILSVEVEQNYSKDDILTGYLNQIPYGNSAYGIEQAAHTYFGKSAKDLTLSEAATLAAVPNAPTYYSPYGNHLDDLFVRKDYILDRMASVGFITKDQANQAKKDAPTFENPTFKTAGSSLLAPHFVNYVRQALIDYIGGDPELAEQKLDEAGYTVTTSLDLPTQNLAQSVITNDAPKIIKAWNATNAGLVTLDPKTGEILAMVGSVDYSASKNGQVNYMASPLNPGSTMKPIVYATAWDPKHKYSPAAITYDLKTNFSASGPAYAPTDYNGSCEYCGPVTDRNALDGSLNISAVKRLALVGVSDAMDTAKSLGITTLTQTPQHYGLPLVLGSAAIEPVEMANAYASFANGGMHNPLRPILTITQGSTMVKDFRTTPATKAIEPDVAWQMSNVLSDNNARAKIFGSKNYLTLPDRPVGAKTGTTENNRDGWTVGFTPSVVTAVWVGNNDDNKVMRAGADGSVVAAPIWNDFMKQYTKGKPVEQFGAPPSDMKEVTIDTLSGKLPTDQTPDSTKVKEILAPWQVPTANDDVHVKVKLDSVSGKLATDLTPLSAVIEKYFFNVHSEQPDNPNWENPVQAWARANGGGVAPPTDSDSVHTADNKPTVNFVSPADGSSVSGKTVTVKVAPGGLQPITQVTLSLNGTVIGTLTAAPWTADADISALSGTQTVSAMVTNDLGMTATQQVSFQVVPDSTPPGSATKITKTDGIFLTKTPITLGWTNPTDADLASVNIYESTTSDPSDLGSLILTIAAEPGKQQTASIDVSSLKAGQTYYFVIRPTDGKNENQSTAKIGATVH